MDELTKKRRFPECETCGQHVHSDAYWTAYYWQGVSRKWECDKCIYRDPKNKKQRRHKDEKNKLATKETE